MTQYQFAKPNLNYSRIADIVRNAISVAAAPFHEGNGFRPDLLAITNCVKFGERNTDGTYQPNIVMEDTFHIGYGNRTIGQLVVDDKVVIDFYGVSPLSRFEILRENVSIKTIPKDRASIEQAIVRELTVRGLIQLTDTSSTPLLP